MQITIIGAGNGGQALASYLAFKGHVIKLYNRSKNRIDDILKCKNIISCSGYASFKGEISHVTDSIKDAVHGAEIIIITTTADAHKTIAEKISANLNNKQIILLNPGRTGGAFEFHEVLNQKKCKADIYLGEAQSLLFACRIITAGKVKIYGEKVHVPVAAYPEIHTDIIVDKLKYLHEVFNPDENVLKTSFHNVGSIFHSGVFLFNAAAIERGSKFYFYQDATPTIVDFIKQLDEERIALGKAYGINLLTVEEWILKTYPDSVGKNLYELMRSNPAYYKIRAPSSLDSRYINEDIPYGLVPYVSFGKAAGLKMPLMTSLINLSCALLKRDFWIEGRTLAKMGFAGKTPDEILSML